MYFNIIPSFSQPSLSRRGIILSWFKTVNSAARSLSWCLTTLYIREFYPWNWMGCFLEPSCTLKQIRWYWEFLSAQCEYDGQQYPGHQNSIVCCRSTLCNRRRRPRFDHCSSSHHNRYPLSSTNTPDGSIYRVRTKATKYHTRRGIQALFPPTPVAEKQNPEPAVVSPKSSSGQDIQ